MFVIVCAQGCIVALDKNLRKIKKLRDNIQLQSVSSAHCFAFDATKALAMEEREFNAMGKVSKSSFIIVMCMIIQIDPGPPPYPAECFDRVLLDPPCSALGQRPQLVCRLSVKDVKSYPVYQRKLLTQVRHIAVQVFEWTILPLSGIIGRNFGPKSHSL